MEESGPRRLDRRAERGDVTRAEIVRTARELFTERGYAAVGTNEVVARAGVTRGAMYHHFPDKRALFRAVYEQTEHELAERVAAKLAAIDDPWERIVAGMRLFFDICTDPRLRQVGLVDGPAVLGWQDWRDIGTRYLFGLVTAGLQAAMDEGVLRRADVRRLAHLVIGALGEAAMVLANAEDPRAERKEVEAAVLYLLEGMRA